MIVGEPGLLISYILLIAFNTLNFVTYISPNFQVLVQTPVLVYIGSVHSLRLYCKTTNVEEEQVETMTKKDALLFPVIGSCTLGGLFLAFKFFDKDIINILFHYYFTFIGALVITQFFYNRFSNCLKSLTETVIFKIPKIPYLTDEQVPCDLLYLILLSLSSIIGAGYFLTKHYYLNNVYGIFFSLVGIETVMMGGSHIGFILLILLFFYDIYWVFFTPVMVSVAKNLEGPIKLLFPKDFFPYTPVELKDFNMIGLGDIVLPGVYVALMFRYDYLRTLGKMLEQKKEILEDSYGNYIVPFSLSNFSTFLFTVFGYIAGIGTTLFIMNFFRHAQPALLYLVPGVLLGSSFAAILRGDFSHFFNFEETKTLEKVGLKEPTPENPEEAEKDGKKQS